AGAGCDDLLAIGGDGDVVRRAIQVRVPSGICRAIVHGDAYAIACPGSSPIGTGGVCEGPSQIQLSIADLHRFDLNEADSGAILHAHLLPLGHQLARDRVQDSKAFAGLTVDLGELSADSQMTV